MYFQHIIAATSRLGLSVENSFFIAIALLSCILGAEIAGICILINKLVHARREKKQREYDAEFLGQYEEEGNSRGYLLIPIVGAVSMGTQLALLVLAVCAAVGALVFTLLLIIFRAKGYSLVSAAAVRRALEAANASAEDSETAYLPLGEDAEEVSVAEETYAEESFDEPEIVASEEPMEETLEEPVIEEAAETEEELSAVAEEESETAEEEAEESCEPVAAAEVEEIVAEDEAPSVPVAVVRPAETPVAYGQAAPGAIPVYSSVYPGGQAPVIEKHITETYKEVIRETTTTTNNNAPAPKAEEKYSPATEEILKAIAELMKLGTQLRMEKVQAVENPAVQNEEAEALLLQGEEEDAEDEIEIEREEEDAEDAEDAADAGAEGDEDYESDLFSSSGRIVGFDEETGCYIVAHYRKSFEAKLIQARPEVKKYYSEIKNALLSYEGNKDRISWTINSYHNDRTPIAKINVRARTLDLYLALDPAALEDSVYHGKDVGDKKKYAETPFLYKVNSPRKLTLALELIQRTCEEQGLSPIDIEAVNYEEQYPFQTTEDLVSKGLIREYLREEKPAVTFELDPDHVPSVPTEDESVIPANANFTWEFDNEEMEKEPEAPVVEEAPAEEPVIEELPAEEPVIEEAPVEEPAPEPAEAVPASVTTTHETVKTTERHYTEIYYGIPGQAPQQTTLISEKPPIEVLAEPVQETVEETTTEETVVEAPAVETAPADPSEEVIDEAFEEELEAELDVELEDVELEEEIEEIEDETEEEIVFEEATEDEAVEDEIEEEIVEDEIEEEIVEDEPEEEIVEDEIEEEIIEDELEEEIVEDEIEEEIVEDEIEEEIVEDEPEEEIIEDEIEEEIAEDEFEEEIVEDEIEEEIIEEESEEELAEDEAEEELIEDETEEEFVEEEEEDEPAEEEYEEIDLEEPEVIEEAEETEETEEVEEEEKSEEAEEEEEEEEEEAETPAPQPIPASNPGVALLDVCLFDDHFENGAIVNLETLKQVGLVAENATKLKVYASGPVKGQFTVEAHHFTLDAIKAISDADGDSIMIR